MLCNSCRTSAKSFPFSLKIQTHYYNKASIFKIKNKTQKISSTKSISAQKLQNQRHFVLVHGACHGAWCWYKVSTLLKSKGHNVTALDMAASGLNPKQVDEISSFSDYFEPLMTFMDSLDLEEKVIIVAHSIAGVGLSIAMENFPEKISTGVFVAATMLGPDFSFKTIAQKISKDKASSMSPMDTQYIFGNGPNNPPTAILLGPNYLASNYYRFSPPQDLELASLLLRPYPVYTNPSAQDDIILTKERFGSLNRIFIVCDEENDDFQRWMIQNNPPNEVKVISGSDHMVMFSKPQNLCSALLEIGDKYY